MHPIVWLALLLIGSWLFRKGKWNKRLKIAFAFVFYAFSNPVLLREAQRLWEDQGVAIEEVEHHDVGIVLGGMFDYNNDLDRLSIRRGGDRLWQALNLYHENKIDKILISGDNGHLIDQGLREAEQIKEVLLKRGIPEEDILIETKSKNTYENAVMSKELLDSMYTETPSIVLITSGTHMKRSLAVFDKLEMQVTPFSTDHYTGEKRNYYFQDFIAPNPACLVEWYTLNHEIVGYAVYKMKGYL